MLILPLQDDTPNQQFTTTQDTDYYVISLRTALNITLVDITRNGVPLVTSKRCPPYQFLLFKYKEAGRGNFAFHNADYKYPNYKDFNSVTFLVYYTPEEMAELRSTQ